MNDGFGTLQSPSITTETIYDLYKSVPESARRTGSLIQKVCGSTWSLVRDTDGAISLIQKLVRDDSTSQSYHWYCEAMLNLNLPQQVIKIMVDRMKNMSPPCSLFYAIQLARAQLHAGEVLASLQTWTSVAHHLSLESSPPSGYISQATYEEDNLIISYAEELSHVLSLYRDRRQDYEIPFQEKISALYDHSIKVIERSLNPQDLERHLDLLEFIASIQSENSYRRSEVELTDPRWGDDVRTSHYDLLLQAYRLFSSNHYDDVLFVCAPEKIVENLRREGIAKCKIGDVNSTMYKATTYRLLKLANEAIFGLKGFEGVVAQVQSLIDRYSCPILLGHVRTNLGSTCLCSECFARKLVMMEVELALKLGKPVFAISPGLRFLEREIVRDQYGQDFGAMALTLCRAYHAKENYISMIILIELISEPGPASWLNTSFFSHDHILMEAYIRLGLNHRLLQWNNSGLKLRVYRTNL